jgi:hypothetical protein
MNSLSVGGADQVVSNNWATVRTTNDYVVITANLNTCDTNAARLLHWSCPEGGNVVPGDPFQWEVPKDFSKKYTVTASCCNTSFTANVWIIWGTVDYQFSSTTPANAQCLWTNCNPDPNYPYWIQSHLMWFEPGFDLGVKTYGDMTAPAPYNAITIYGTNAYAKECTIIHITPAGINAIVTNGFKTIQDIKCHEFRDGQYYADRSRTSWDDDSPADYHNTHGPDISDCLYAIDGPNIGNLDRQIQAIGATNMYEVHQNFMNYETFKEAPCSDTNYWHFEAAWFAGPPQVINHKNLGAAPISLPTTNLWNQ